MTYISGTITNANSGATLYAALEPVLAGAGFTLEDTVVISTRTHKVWKSPAASNFRNQDWYLDITYPTAGTGMFFMRPFEFFDAATDLAYRGPYAYGSRTSDATYYAPFGGTGYGLETSWVPNPASSSTGASGHTGTSVLPSTAFGYWCSITSDRVILMTSVDPSWVLYCGLYTPSEQQVAASSSDVYPLVTTLLSGYSVAISNAAASTRYPRYSTAANIAWANVFEVSQQLSILRPSRIPDGDTSASGGHVASPLHLVTTVSAPAQSSWGTLRDIRTCRAAPDVVRGDTVTIDGAQWVLATPGAATEYSILFKAA